MDLQKGQKLIKITKLRKHLYKVEKENPGNMWEPELDVET